MLTQSAEHPITSAMAHTDTTCVAALQAQSVLQTLTRQDNLTVTLDDEARRDLQAVIAAENCVV